MYRCSSQSSELRPQATFHLPAIHKQRLCCWMLHAAATVQDACSFVNQGLLEFGATTFASSKKVLTSHDIRVLSVAGCEPGGTDVDGVSAVVLYDKDKLQVSAASAPAGIAHVHVVLAASD